MKRTYLLCAFFFSYAVLHAQTNLVPNGDFEEYTDCPYCCYTVQASLTSFPFVSDWFSATSTTPDYFNSCGDEATSGGIPYTIWWGYNPEHICNGMLGFFVYEGTFPYREYVETKLSEPLEAGVQYYVEFYATTAFNPCGGATYDFIVATDELGAYFSEEAVTEWFSVDYYLDFVPQVENEEGIYLEDTATWYKVSGIFTAAGGEEYMTIGTFVSDDELDFVYMGGLSSGSCQLSSYVFIDDVIVAEYTGVETTPPGEVILCEGETVDLSGPFDANSYTWSSGDTTQTITISAEGEYSLVAYFDCDTVEYNYSVFVSPTTDTSTYQSLELCTTELPVTLIGEPGYTTYEWNVGTFNDSLSVTEGGLYIVTAANICNIHTDSFFVDALNPDGIFIDLGNDTLICTNDPWQLTLNAENVFDNYNWNTGETTSSIFVNAAGVYSVTAENVCGTWFDEIEIEAGIVLFKPDIGPDLVLCEDDNFTVAVLSAQPQDCSYYWVTGENTQSISVTVPGLYWVECTNICGKVRDSVIVQLCTYLYVPNAFTPNGDGINDFLAPVYYQNVTLISFDIYNRWGELLFSTTDLSEGWDGTFNGEQMPMETYVFVVQYDEYGYVSKKQGSVTLVR